MNINTETTLVLQRSTLTLKPGKPRTITIDDAAMTEKLQSLKKAGFDITHHQATDGMFCLWVISHANDDRYMAVVDDMTQDDTEELFKLVDRVIEETAKKALGA